MDSEKKCPECENELDPESGICEKCGFDGMIPGDQHSGPYGYTPGVGYQETQYGSGFDEEAAWYR